MNHSIHFKELNTTLIVDETMCENICIQVENRDSGKILGHHLTPDDLENLIHLLKYVQAKKKEINPVYGQRISALSIKGVKMISKANGRG